MEVILRTDMENLGKLGDVVKVKPGYARNYLIPKELAMQATPSNLKVFEQQRRKLQEKLDKARAEAESLAGRLEETVITIPVRVGESDKLYGSVTSAMISEALAQQGLEVDKKDIELDNPIRSLGEHQVPVKLYSGVRPELKVNVVRHGEESASSGEGE
ncbi:50S ribosomal protein L9 [Desulfovermiculus halophilus]|jgi:large subunit ribosomal protein L9|uniref:50S ribosomal protein L9 n=1 Tax=Desulfovermiculus halophilus TaxID=339722 RepID=UPI0005541F0A|nr:50S ribosomal protein L9 [Desulfovermiculus halophilus]